MYTVKIYPAKIAIRFYGDRLYYTRRYNTNSTLTYIFILCIRKNVDSGAPGTLHYLRCNPTSLQSMRVSLKVSRQLHSSGI